MHNIYVYILIMALVTYAIRALPLILVKGEIKSTLLQSFLYYVPYVTLSIMTFPAILHATNSIVSAMAGFLIAILIAFKGGSLFKVAIGACLTVFLLETFL